MNYLYLYLKPKRAYETWQVPIQSKNGICFRVPETFQASGESENGIGSGAPWFRSAFKPPVMASELSFGTQDSDRSEAVMGPGTPTTEPSSVSSTAKTSTSSTTTASTTMDGKVATFAFNFEPKVVVVISRKPHP